MPLLQQMDLSIPVLSLLENIHGCSPDFWHHVCESMHGPPATNSAGSFGWVRRARCYWGSDGVRSSQSLSKPTPASGSIAPITVRLANRVRHKKFWLADVSFDDDKRPLFDPAANAASSDEGALFPVFARAFPHRPD